MIGNYTISVTRPAGGTQAADGAFTVGTPTTVYAGPCDYQENDLERLPSVDSLREEMGTGRVFLFDGVSVSGWRPADVVTLTDSDGNTFEGHVTKTSRIDESAFVRVKPS